MILKFIFLIWFLTGLLCCVGLIEWGHDPVKERAFTRLLTYWGYAGALYIFSILCVGLLTN